MKDLGFSEEKIAKYHQLAHAMQSGVAAMQHYDATPTSPKHLRVGVNSAMVETTVIVEILVAKGVLTYDEFLDALIAGMEREVQTYESKLSELTGANITLG
ncbi:MAG: hypothetical protein KDE50_16715 [Caldilineaceae bacterium]|nr:hypothetical protein [Caldilineaceae bacterium]MCB0141551.1 hypothetical protein [Caldilineaceae bacterium]